MPEDKPPKIPPVLRVAISTDDLPEHFDDQARRAVWEEFRKKIFGESFEETFADDRSFSMLGEVAQFGTAGIGRIAGTLTRLSNTPDGREVEGRDEFAFGINQGVSPMIQRQLGRELVQPPGAPGLMSNADAGEILAGPVTDWCSVILPSAPLRELVRDVDDLVAREIDPGKPAMKYFRRYVALLLQPDGIEDDPLLVDHVSTTLLDLVALCLDTGRDGAEVATMRGVRAARLQLAFAEIRERFSDPGFSVEQVANKIGLSPRRVQGLLHEAGSSFTERVLELRLQRARSILTSRRHNGFKVSEIALTSGFNDISYFNRRFRKRFGCSPTQYRNTDLTES